MVPLGLRAIPEVIAWQFPIGYDSIGSYVPLMMDWASGHAANQIGPALGGKLMFALFGFSYSISKIDPVFLVKIAGPILYGGLGGAEYLFARRFLLWKRRESLFLVIIASAYFVSLRLSWDLLSNTLALVFLFLALAVRPALANSKFACLGFSVLLLLSVATHLLVGALGLSIIFLQLISASQLRARISLAIVPSALLYFSSILGLQIAGVHIVSLGISVVNPLQSYAFAIYLFIPILPLAVVGRKSVRSSLVRNWMVICVIGVFLSTAPIGISSQLVWPERWAFLMVFPIALYATRGFIKLGQLNLKISHLGPLLQGMWTVLLLTLAITYIALPAESAFAYYRFIAPTSMLQSTIPLEDSQSVVTSFRWLSTNISRESAVIVNDAMYGWSREYYTGMSVVIRLNFGASLDQGVSIAVRDGYSLIYTVWWANGNGWYGEPTVPPGFSLVRLYGEFGVFEYSP